MDDLGSLVVRIETKMDNFNKGIQSAGEKMKKFAKIGMVAGAAITAATAVIGVKAVNAAADFEKGMANVATLLDGNVTPRIQELSKNITNLMTNTGQSAEVLQDGLYQVISAFGDSADSMNILETAAKGAAAGNATVTDSVNLLSAVTKGYGDTSSEAAQKASDLAFLTVKLGQTTFPELASSMGKVIPLAGTLKVSQEELFGAMATLTGVTGGAAQVSTQLRGIFTDMMAPSEQLTEALGNMGYSSGAAALESIGLQGTLQGLLKQTNGNTVEFANLFGRIEGTTAALALVGTQADTFTRKTKAMDAAVGSTEEAFKKQQATFSVTMNRIKESMNVLFIHLGEKLLPKFQKMADWVLLHMPEIQAFTENAFEKIGEAITFTSNAVNKLTGFFSDHWDTIQPILAGIAAGAGTFALYALGLKAAALATGIWTTVTTIATAAGAAFGAVMAFITAPIGLVVLAIGALVAAGVYLYKNWDTVRLNMLKIFDNISYKVRSAISFMKITVLKGIDTILGGFEKLIGFVPGLGKAITIARDKISSMIDEEKVKQNARTFVNAANQASYAVELQEIEIKKLEVANEDTTVATEKLTQAKKEAVIATKKSTEATKKSEEVQKKAAETAKRLREETIRNLDDLGDAIKKALVKRYEEEERLQIDSLTKQSDRLKEQTQKNIDQYDKEYAAKLKLFDAETSAELKALQAQIDAINAQTDAEEEAIREREYQERFAAKQKELAEAETAEEKLSLTAELNDMIAKKEREHLLKSRKQQITAIRNEMDLVRTRAEEKREAMRLELEEKKAHEQALFEEKQKGITAEMKSVNDHYKALKTEEALQHKARKLVVAENNEEIIELLETYNPKWQDAGQSFGQSLLDGLNSTKQSIKNTVNEIFSMIDNGRTGTGAKISSYIVKSGDTLSQVAMKFKTTVSELAKLNKIADVNLIRVGQELKIPAFAKGASFVPFDTMAFLHKGEAVVPASNNPSNTNATNPIGQTINNYFNIDQLNVRDDNDRKAIARELHNLQISRGRGGGVVYGT